jgi:hypothetical protein
LAGSSIWLRSKWRNYAAYPCRGPRPVSPVRVDARGVATRRRSI